MRLWQDTPAKLSVGVLFVGVVSACRTPAVKDPEVGTSAFTHVGGYLEVTGEKRRRDQTSTSGGNDFSSDETVLTESLKLESEGYVYHPNLIAFGADFLLGGLQNDFESTSTSTLDERESGNILGYDVSVDLLRGKNYPATVFANRFEGLEPRPFFTSTRLTTDEYGARLSYSGPETSTRLLWNHSSVLNEPLGSGEQNRKHVNDLVRLESEHAFSEDNRLSFSIAHEESDRSPTPASFDVNEVQLRHELRFGPESKNRLDSSLTSYSQTGTIDVDRTQLNERLWLSHGEDLRSRYALNLREREQGASGSAGTFGEQSGFLSGALEHQLYDNLNTELGGFLERQEFDGATEIQRTNGHLNLHYHRNTPWGLLTVGAVSARNVLDREGSGPLLVVDEQHTFVDPLPIILIETFIDVSTIIVTDMAGTQIYIEGLDYTVFVMAGRVELNRVPTGNIANGQAVLVDYEVPNAGDDELETWNQHYTVRQNFFGGWASYYRLQVQDQAQMSGGAGGSTAPEDIRAHTVGVEYRDGAFNAGVEYSDYESDITPFESVRLNCGYSLVSESGVRASLAGSWVNIRHRLPIRRESEYLSIDGSYRQPLGPRAFLDCRVRYLDDQDSASNLDNQGVDVDVFLEWLYRTLEIRVIYESGFFENQFSENESSRVYAQIRRVF